MTSRPFLSLIQKHSLKRGFSFYSVIPDYVYRVQKGKTSFIMQDVDPGLNRTSSFKVTKSKSQCYSILYSMDIPAVEHIFLPNPTSNRTAESSYDVANQYFERYKDVVIKPDNGGGGSNVHRIKTMEQLTECLNDFYALEKKVVISPYLESPFEYRTTVLNGEPRLTFAKEKYGSWRHNLSGNGGAKIVNDINVEDLKAIEELAVNAANALGLKFCTVDIFRTETGLHVIEANTSVYLSHYAKLGTEESETVGTIYADALTLRYEDEKK